jgi:hypothetical protein
VWPSLWRAVRGDLEWSVVVFVVVLVDVFVVVVDDLSLFPQPALAPKHKIRSVKNTCASIKRARMKRNNTNNRRLQIK